LAAKTLNDVLSQSKGFAEFNKNAAASTKQAEQLAKLTASRKLAEERLAAFRAQEQAKAYILQAVSDQKITAEEQVKIGQNLAILMSTLRIGQTDQLKGIQDLINMNNTLQTQMNAMQRQIDQINQKRKSPIGVQ